MSTFEGVGCTRCAVRLKLIKPVPSHMVSKKWGLLTYHSLHRLLTGILKEPHWPYYYFDELLRLSHNLSFLAHLIIRCANVILFFLVKEILNSFKLTASLKCMSNRMWNQSQPCPCTLSFSRSNKISWIWHVTSSELITGLPLHPHTVSFHKYCKIMVQGYGRGQVCYWVVEIFPRCTVSGNLPVLQGLSGHVWVYPTHELCLGSCGGMFNLTPAVYLTPTLYLFITHTHPHTHCEFL